MLMRPMSIFTPDSVAVRCTATAAGRAELRGLQTGTIADTAAQLCWSRQAAVVAMDLVMNEQARVQPLSRREP